MSDMQPFYIEVDGSNHSRILQEIAFEAGYGWNGEKKEVKHTISSFLFFTPEGNGIWKNREITHANDSAHVNKDRDNELEDPSLEEFRQALRGEYQWEEPIEIGGYEVEFKDNSISVGCEEWSHDKVKSIYEVLRIGDEAPNTSSTLHLRLSHPDVGEIPFEKVKAIYNRITN